jgi:hypothetical protein
MSRMATLVLSLMCLLILSRLSPSPVMAQMPIEPGLDPQLMVVWSDVQDPCRAVPAALRRMGIDPSNRGNLVAQQIMNNAWGIMLPALDAIATDTSLAGDPDRLTGLIDDQVRRPRQYSTSEATDMLQRVADAASRAMAGIYPWHPTEPGVVLLATIWGDSRLQDAWRYTVQTGDGWASYPRSARESMWRRFPPPRETRC